MRAPGDIPVLGETAETIPTKAFTIHTGSGGSDGISAGGDADIVFGGFAGDVIAGDGDADVLIGDNGEVVYEGSVIAQIRTTDVSTATGSSDEISGGTGDDLILGGVNGSQDVLSGGSGNDVVVGDNGEFIFDHPVDPDLLTLDLIRTFNDGLGGEDVIFGNEDDDLLIGGGDRDFIDGDEGNDLIFGDSILLLHRVGDVTDPRFQTLLGQMIYSRHDLPTDLQGLPG